MVGKEYIDILKENIDCFDFKVSDLNYLYNTHIESMGLMESRVYKITPTLEQISLYAMGAAFYNELEYDSLRKLTSGDKIEAIMETCYDYMNTLVINGCNHPTVLIYKSLINGSNMYNTMMEDLSDSAELVSGDIQDRIIEFLENVDNKIANYKDNSYSEVELKLKAANNDKKMLKAFGENGRKRALTELLVATMYFSYNCDDAWTKIYSNSEESDPKFTLEFIEMIQLVEENLPFLDYDEESDLEDYFNEFREAYYLYKGCQYEYLQNSYKEARILQKCNKM